jgi:Domain of unknown function (DUF4349)
MRARFLVVPLLIAIAGCSQNPTTKDEAAIAPQAAESAAADAMSSPEGEAPDIGANVAPGVAFTYAYNFALPEANIARVQGDHAAACEKLGIIHCRVTGMTFRKQSGEELSAMLSFKLDPAMANSFARGATDIVTRADGSLSSSDVAGNDTGSEIVNADRTNAALLDNLTKINAQLKIPGLSREVRSRLVEEANSIRAQMRELGNKRDNDVESLATTPVVFTYVDNAAILGFDSNSPVQQAIKSSTYSFSAMVSFVMLAVGVLAPWVLLGLGVFWIVRRVRGKRAVAKAE